MNFTELFESIYSQNLHHDSRKFVELFNHNRILIEGQNISSNEVLYDQVTIITTDYAHSLILSESYSKAQPEIDKAIKLFENHPEYKGQELLEFNYYETMIFDRAVVNYYAKNYKESIVDLNTLIQKYPDNEKYQNWHKSAQAYKLNKFENVFYIFLAVTLFADLLFDDLDPTIDKLIIITFGISLLTIAGIELIKWKRRRKTT